VRLHKITERGSLEVLADSCHAFARQTTRWVHEFSKSKARKRRPSALNHSRETSCRASSYFFPLQELSYLRVELSGRQVGHQSLLNKRGKIVEEKVAALDRARGEEGVVI